MQVRCKSNVKLAHQLIALVKLVLRTRFVKIWYAWRVMSANPVCVGPTSIDVVTMENGLSDVIHSVRYGKSSSTVIKGFDAKNIPQVIVVRLKDAQKVADLVTKDVYYNVFEISGLRLSATMVEAADL